MDVGCDHGLVVKYALKNDICAVKAYATDISDTCLDKARRNLADFEKAECVCGNGIVATPLKPDFIVICGMGGNTISDILHSYNEKATLLLSPHSHPELVRQWLVQNKYKIVHDSCYEFKNKYYDIIKAVPSDEEMNMSNLELKYGNYKVKNDALKNRLERQLARLIPELDLYKEVSEVLKWQE